MIKVILPKILALNERIFTRIVNSRRNLDFNIALIRHIKSIKVTIRLTPSTKLQVPLTLMIIIYCITNWAKVNKSIIKCRATTMIFRRNLITKIHKQYSKIKWIMKIKKCITNSKTTISLTKQNWLKF